MSASSERSRRIGWGAKALVVTSAVVVMTAPSASAAVDDLIVPTSNVVAGTEYTILWSGSSSSPIGGLLGTTAVFTDNGKCFSGEEMVGFLDVGSSWSGQAGYRRTKWTPADAGVHTITLTIDGSKKSETVTVLPAPAGTQPAPAQSPTGCSSSGSSDS